ncbi:MAG: MarR family transcriptional regulator [Thermoleophilia bacterium]|nr:MarR family transcriptional regulator [Thermoleophilia bacterium]
MAQAAPATTKTSKVDDPAYAAAWQAIRNSHLTVVERIESELSDSGLPDLAWYDVLVKLEVSAAPVRPKDMLCQVSVTKSGLTRLLDRIEKAGLIERSYCPSDRRGTFLSITNAGRSTLAEMKPIRDRVFDAHFVGSLSEAEAEVITELLSRVAASAVGELEAQGDCDV